MSNSEAMGRHSTELSLTGAGGKRAFTNRFKRVWATRRLVSRTVAPTMAVGLIALTLLVGGVMKGSAPAVVSSPRPMVVKTRIAREESYYTKKRSYLGRIEPRRQSELSFELSGKITKVLADEGQAIKQGQVLAQLDTLILSSNRDALVARVDAATARLDELNAGPRQEDIVAAQANVQRWHAQLKLAQITRQRLVKLSKISSVSKQEADDSIFNEQVVQAQLDVAKADLLELQNGTRREKVAAQHALVNQLKAELATIQLQIEKSQILSPFDGVIAKRFFDEGQVVSVGQSVLILMETGVVEARIGLPVESIGELRLRDSVQLSCRNQTIVASVQAIRPDKSPVTRTVDVLFRVFDEKGQRFSIGDLVQFHLDETVVSSGFWIPVDALVESYRGLWGCYVLSPTGSDTDATVTELRELEVLYQTDDRAFVSGSLRAGEEIIVSGVHRLVTGQSVTRAAFFKNRGDLQVGLHDVLQRNDETGMSISQRTSDR